MTLAKLESRKPFRYALGLAPPYSSNVAHEYVESRARIMYGIANQKCDITRQFARILLSIQEPT